MPKDLAQFECPPSNWWGNLNSENARYVAKWINALLGGKEYIVYESDTNDPAHPRVESRKGHLKAEWTDHSPDLVRCEVKDDGVAHIMFSGTDGYLYMMWSYPDKAWAKTEDQYSQPYLKFFHGTLTVTQRAPAGNLCVNHFVPVQPMGDDVWWWCGQQEAHLYGRRNDGAAVYWDMDGYHANVVHPYQSFFLGPFKKAEEAQAEALEWLFKLRNMDKEAA